MSLSAGLLMVFMFAEATTTAAPAPAKPPEEWNKVICKRAKVTGSLIQSRKECHTRREWQRLADEAQVLYEKMNPHKGSQPGG